MGGMTCDVKSSQTVTECLLKAAQGCDVITSPARSGTHWISFVWTAGNCKVAKFFFFAVKAVKEKKITLQLFHLGSLGRNANGFDAVVNWYLLDSGLRRGVRRCLLVKVLMGNQLGLSQVFSGSLAKCSSRERGLD